jgi:hypothetical protein
MMFVLEGYLTPAMQNFILLHCNPINPFTINFFDWPVLQPLGLASLSEAVVIKPITNNVQLEAKLQVEAQLNIERRKAVHLFCALAASVEHNVLRSEQCLVLEPGENKPIQLRKLLEVFASATPPIKLLGPSSYNTTIMGHGISHKDIAQLGNCFAGFLGDHAQQGRAIDYNVLVILEDYRQLPTAILLCQQHNFKQGEGWLGQALALSNFSGDDVVTGDDGKLMTMQHTLTLIHSNAENYFARLERQFPSGGVLQAHHQLAHYAAWEVDVAAARAKEAAVTGVQSLPASLALALQSDPTWTYHAPGAHHKSKGKASVDKKALAVAAELKHTTSLRTDAWLKEHMGPVQNDSRVQARVKAVLNELHAKREVLLRKQEDDAVQAAALAIFEQQIDKTGDAEEPFAMSSVLTGIGDFDDGDEAMIVAAPAPAAAGAGAKTAPPASAPARAPAPGPASSTLLEKLAGPRVLCQGAPPPPPPPPGFGQGLQAARAAAQAKASATATAEAKAKADATALARATAQAKATADAAARAKAREHLAEAALNAKVLASGAIPDDGEAESTSAPAPAPAPSAATAEDESDGWGDDDCDSPPLKGGDDMTAENTDPKHGKFDNTPTKERQTRSNRRKLDTEDKVRPYSIQQIMQSMPHTYALPVVSTVKRLALKTESLDCVAHWGPPISHAKRQELFVALRCLHMHIYNLTTGLSKWRRDNKKGMKNSHFTFKQETGTIYKYLLTPASSYLTLTLVTSMPPHSATAIQESATRQASLLAKIRAMRIAKKIIRSSYADALTHHTTHPQKKLYKCHFAGRARISKKTRRRPRRIFFTPKRTLALHQTALLHTRLPPRQAFSHSLMPWCPFTLHTRATSKKLGGPGLPSSTRAGVG